MAIICPISAERVGIYESELLRQENFSDIYGIAVPYMFKVEVYTCVSSALRWYPCISLHTIYMI